MMRYAVAAGLVVAAPVGLAQQAVVPVTVMEKSNQAPAGKPFKGVGVFQVFRGGTKVANASCPDLSNEQGKLSCLIPCTATDVVPANLEIRPPESLRRARGYKTPPASNVQVLGCKVSWQKPPEFVYVDSFLALAQLAQSEPRLGALVSTAGSNITVAPTSEALPALAKLAETPAGLQTISTFQTLTNLAAERAEDVDRKASDQLMQLSVGASNILLQELTRINFGQAKDLKITGAREDYYGNLKTIEVDLQKTPARSPQQNILLNDVQQLRKSPYKPQQQPQIQRHLGISR